MDTGIVVDDSREDGGSNGNDLELNVQIIRIYVCMVVKRYLKNYFLLPMLFEHLKKKEVLGSE